MEVANGMAAVSSRVRPRAGALDRVGWLLSQAGAPAFPGQGHRHAVEDHWCERIGWMQEWASDGCPQMTQMDADRGRAGLGVCLAFLCFSRGALPTESTVGYPARTERGSEEVGREGYRPMTQMDADGERAR